MAENVGILLDDDLDLLIGPNGTFVNGDSELDEVAVILSLSPGELTSDPLLGPSLLRLTRGVNGAGKAVALTKLHLTRDGKDYNDIKRRMRFNLDER